MIAACEKGGRAETRGGLTVWRGGSKSTAIVARVAVAGDFLPTGKINIAESATWHEKTAPILPHFADIDVTFANLECPLGTGELPARPLNGIGQIVSAERESLEYLCGIRCAAVSIANNHAWDFGRAGVERTRALVVKAGLTPLGAGQSLREPPEVSVWRGRGGLCVGFWAAARASRELATRRIAGVEPATVERAEVSLAAMKRCGVNFSVALIHAGCIRSSRPAPEDVDMVRSVAKSGFNLVACSHSHRVAGFEMIPQRKGAAFCFYGLGSLVSGYTASDIEREGLIAVAGLDSDGLLVEMSVRPVYLPQSGIGEVPSPERAEEILGRFKILSREISDGSYKKQFYREVSHGLLELYWRDLRTAIQQSGARGLARKAARVRLCHVKRLMHRVFAT